VYGVLVPFQRLEAEQAKLHNADAAKCGKKWRLGALRMRMRRNAAENAAECGKKRTQM